MLLRLNEIKNINKNMVKSGSYSGSDYSIMNDIAKKEILTIGQVIFVVKILAKYTNTQLSDKKNDIDETLRYLNNTATDKTMYIQKNLNVISRDPSVIRLSWKYDANVNSFLKSTKEINSRWEKVEDKWVFVLSAATLSPFVKGMERLGYDVKDLKGEAEVPPQIIAPMPVAIRQTEVDRSYYEIKVFRPEETISTLYIEVVEGEITLLQPYMEKYGRYDRKNKVFEIEIADSYRLYQALKESGLDINMNSLIYWSELVRGWETDYHIMNLNRINLPFTPYDFQPEDIKQMLKDKTVLNANDMGCGKTFESVITGESIPVKKLVICPATLRLNWEKEIRMINPDADVSILYSNKPFRVGSDWTIVGYPSVAIFQSELEAENFQCIFIDEAHYCMAVSSKGLPTSQRAKAVLRLTATSGRVYALTGTPKPTRNKDIYNILKMIRHDLVKGNSFFKFATDFCDAKQTKMGWDFDGNSNDIKLNELIKPQMIRHLKRDVLPHLKKIRMSIPVEINLCGYRRNLIDYEKRVRNKQTAQLACLSKAKLSIAIEKVKETAAFAKDLISDGNKVIIVTCVTEVVDRIMKEFEGNVVCIDGRMNDKKKNEAKDRFQEGDEQVLVMNIEAGGVGLTLTRSHFMIFNDYDWTVGNIVQAEDRICRGDQKECCMIYYMTAIGAKEEEQLVNTLTRKSISINDTVDGGTGEIIDFRALVEASFKID